MKTNQELKELSLAVFERFPNAEVLHATRDGQFFLDENRARLHAGKGQVIPISPPTPEGIVNNEGDVANETDTEEGQVIALNAKETAKQVMETKTIEDLKAFESDARVAVQKAYTRRLAALTASTGNNPEGTNPENIQ